MSSLAHRISLLLDVHAPAAEISGEQFDAVQAISPTDLLGVAMRATACEAVAGQYRANLELLILSLRELIAEEEDDAH